MIYLNLILFKFDFININLLFMKLIEIVISVFY